MDIKTENITEIYEIHQKTTTGSEDVSETENQMETAIQQTELNNTSSEER